MFFFVSLYANSGSPTRYCVGLAGDLKPQQIRAHRLTVRTTGFHPVNVGSTPAGRANSDVAQLVEPLAVNQLVARSSRAIRASLILTALSHCALARIATVYAAVNPLTNLIDNFASTPQ